MIDIAEHPLLELHAFRATLPLALGQWSSPLPWLALLQPEAVAPMQTGDEVKGAVRGLLRHGGFKPSGRSKPASEYLLKAAAGGYLGPINPVVDACNVVSLHSGLPISVVDVDRTQGSLSVSICPPETSYVFNASGQEIRLDGLLCLHDALGPCANAVKDSQRTKTHEGTTEVIILVWGTTALPERGAQAAAWYRQLLEEAGGVIEPL